MKVSITQDELNQLFESKKPMIIDVRSREEYDNNHLPIAGNLPIEIIESGKFIPEPGRIIITVCGKGGGRSEKAAKYFTDHFQNETYFLEGGTFGWNNKKNT